MISKQFSKARPHPWHGLEVGPSAPAVVNAFIEITPFDLVKYELDKVSGYLKVDRPQRTSSLPPSLYGFIPRTLCGNRVAALSSGTQRGDEDPLDICIISERPIRRAEVILRARVIGAIQTVDRGEADDKIVATLDNDNIFEDINDISNLPHIYAERLKHYFGTYKMDPTQASAVAVKNVCSREQAYDIINAAVADYNENFAV